MGSAPSCCPDTAALRRLARAGVSLAPTVAPIRVALVGAAGQLGYALLPMIASGEMFGPGRRVILQCLDLLLPQVQENMRGIEMELQDGNFPLLHQAFFTTDEKEALNRADYAILLGSFPSNQKERREVMEKNSMIFRTIGYAIDNHASKDCKVLVVGQPSCSNALVCSYYAPATPKENFSGVTRLDQNRAAGQLAQQAGVPVGDVENVVVWGTSARGADAEHCTIRGKAVPAVLHSEKQRRWLEEDFVKETQQRGARIQEARKATCAMSTARAVVDHARDLYMGTRPDQFVSMGVWSTGNEYGVAPGLFFSMPVVCTGRGRYVIAKGLNVDQRSRAQIIDAEKELIADRELAEEFARKHNLPVAAAS